MVASTFRHVLPHKFPEPAVHCEDEKVKSKEDSPEVNSKKPTPGTLPNAEISNAARGLLMKLLEVNPQYRLKSLRQVQQTAFFLGFNFGDIKIKKISPKIMLQQYGEENGYPEITENVPFTSFNQDLRIIE